ncbi:MAG: hypothetical protein ABIL86_08240 [candidate division WOR-3 bacterium]
MKVLPIAFDSLGARSMATFIETKDVKIFIDPAVSLSPDRFSLPPHKVEIDRHRKLWEDIKKWACLADIIIITHYHYDHHNPNEPELFKEKEIFIKDPHEFINESQKNRAAFFLSQIEGKARSIVVADGRSFNFGQTKITFSPPVYHGQNNRLGYVLMVLIEENTRFVFSSDIQGPLVEEPVNFIIKNDPEILFLDGPSTYLVGSHYKKTDMECALNYLKKIISSTQIKDFVIDHHLLRDLNWEDFVVNLRNINHKTKIQSAARFRGNPEDLLEALRKDFYEGKCQFVDRYE